MCVREQMRERLSCALSPGVPRPGSASINEGPVEAWGAKGGVVAPLPPPPAPPPSFPTPPRRSSATAGGTMAASAAPLAVRDMARVRATSSTEGRSFGEPAQKRNNRVNSTVGGEMPKGEVTHLHV